MQPSRTRIPDQEEIIPNKFREVIFYLIFLVITTIVILSACSMYWLTNVIESELLDDEFEATNDAEITIYQTKNFEELWLALDNILDGSFYWSRWYKDGSSASKEKVENKLLGVPRLRQLRVKANSCKVCREFQSIFEYCYSDYCTQCEDKESFGPRNSSAWIYHSENELEGKSYKGIVATYSGGGFYQDLSLSKMKTMEIIKKLKTNLWLSRQSRVLFLDMTIYNGNVNSFCVVKIVFELPPTGGVVVTKNINTVKLIQYVTKLDYFILACEQVATGFLVYYTMQLTLKLKLQRKKYFTSVWNFIDLTIILLGYLYIILRLYTFILTRNQLSKLSNNSKIFVSFERPGFWHSQLNNVFGVLLFIIWIKVFKYTTIFNTVSLLLSTLSKCASDISGFVFTFLLYFIAFAQVGYLLLGANNTEFNSFTRSLFSLLKVVNGEVDYDNFESDNKLLIPLYFVTFVFFVFFLLLNMFLAIINDAYVYVKTQIVPETVSKQAARFFKRGARRIFKKCKIIRKCCEDDENEKNETKISNIKKVLKKCKYTDLEIELLYSKYNIEDNDDIEDDEVSQFENTVLQSGYQLQEAADFVRSAEQTSSPLITMEDFKTVENQITTLREGIDKINKLLDNLYEKDENDN